MIKGLLNNFTATQKKALIIAMMLAWLAKSIPIISFVSYYYTIAFHELGHAITAWLFGYFAIPTFDVINGGGVTYKVSRPFILCVIAFVFIILNLLLFKQNPKKNRTKKLLFLFVVYVAVFFSQIHSLLISFMGAGGEVLASFLIGWYALNIARYKINIKVVFYLFLSMLLWVNVTSFSLSLIFDQQSQIDYIKGKQQVMGGGALTNDLVKLLEATGFSINFYSWVLLLFSVVTLYFLIRVAQTPHISKVKLFNYLRTLVAIFRYYARVMWLKLTRKS